MSDCEGMSDSRPGHRESGTGAGDGNARGRRCPICGRPTVHEVRPFCSKRCKDIDLHRWLGGHYAIPVVEEDAGKGDPDTEPPEPDDHR